ncbi:hypothetical protein INT44_007740 [Umbelopsis vinacea]|uniref:Uncharacterized protein n=1 Tax=Umbelopsis vinacea TaxID=44442 RepID=A0A8H7UBA4_9FUNG|nr:hypothetical protein INT44_007740 [Umbelopsis vinacea]
MSTTKNGQPEEPMATKTPLALPATADSDSVTSAEVNSSFKLSELGPVGKVSCVINENGTMSRIENWHEMNDIERANVNRILLKRNKARLEKLKKEREGTME